MNFEHMVTNFDELPQDIMLPISASSTPARNSNIPPTHQVCLLQLVLFWKHADRIWAQYSRKRQHADTNQGPIQYTHNLLPTPQPANKDALYYKKYEHYKKLYQDSSQDSERQQRDAKKRESELREELKVMECEAQEHCRSVGIDVLKFCDETLLQEQVTTLTQADARLQWCLNKTVVRQNGVTGGSQANASVSVHSLQSPTVTCSSQKPASGLTAVRMMKTIREMGQKHWGNGGLIPLRLNCKKVRKLKSYQ